MRALVTGAGGFIGSHLVDHLLSDGHQVLGVDCFTDYYDPARKRSHLVPATGHPGFELVEADLVSSELGPLLSDVDVVYHLAGQPGVRQSWGEDFGRYAAHNIGATQRLLTEAARAGVVRFVLASSSSVYGDAPVHPTAEDDPTAPMSPYGVTKLAAEHLCRLYAASCNVSAVSLRYFTVYGPRQRPDMALHRLIQAATEGRPGFPLYGTGQQIRDFTYVTDVVAATALAGVRPLEPGTVLNIAGGSATSLTELISVVEEIVGRSVPVVCHGPQPGDVPRTGGTITRARELLGWAPRVTLPDGVAAQVDWYRLTRGGGAY